ncbi:MAG: hypothetical protein WCT14_18140 [Treponemataceae bacterium]
MDAIKDRLSRLLDVLARTELGRRNARSDELHRAALNYESVPRLPVTFAYPLPAGFDFQPFPNGAIYRDPAAMLYNELVSAWGTSIAGHGFVGDDLPATVRPNWGTVIVATLFGGKAVQAEDATPWIARSPDAAMSLESIAEADPDVEHSGWVPRVLDTYAAYRDLLSPYPELAVALRITLSDLQGPLDTVEQLMGGDLFIEMVDHPDLAARAFMRAAELQTACARLFEPFVNDGPAGFSHQHGTLIKGRLLIRNDSAVMISPELYRDLVAPADELVLAAAGGGGVHSCGRVGYVAPRMFELPSIRCFDFGQSELNDVDDLYRRASEQRIPFIRVRPTKKELETGSISVRFPTGVSLRCELDSADEAKATFDRYQTIMENKV